MKKKQSLPIFLLIPVVAVVAILLVAFVVRLRDQSTMPTGLDFPTGSAGQAGKPASGFTAAPINPETVTTGNLQNELDTTVDDGGAADIDSLKSEASGL